MGIVVGNTMDKMRRGRRVRLTSFSQTRRGAIHRRHQTRASHDENRNHDGTLSLSHLEFKTAVVVMASIAPAYLEILQQSVKTGVAPLLKTSLLHL
jgi:hypothetical protein